MVKLRYATALVRSSWLVTFLIILLSGSQAEADWQYTRWGMTVHQVFVAAKGKLEPTPFGDADVLANGNAKEELRGDYRSGELRFKVKLYFDGQNKLCLVMLKPIDSLDPTRLEATLTAKYGKPYLDSTDDSFTVRRWLGDGSRVEELTIKPIDSTSIRYWPMSKEDMKGL